jgi:caffeoyl-CoA O-methyltransferase
MEIVDHKAELYAQQFSSEEDQLLKEIAEFTNREHAREAKMLSGHVQGKFLEMISCLLQPERILEVGTFTGYSALCLAKGLKPNGVLHTIELREEDADISEGHFSKSLSNNKIVLHRGDASEIIPQLNEQWDIVFIDADKVNYIKYYELTLQKVKKNGLIIADNVLFHGDVLEEKIKGKNAVAIHEFNTYVANDNRTEQVILTVRDGLSLIRKL